MKIKFMLKRKLFNNKLNNFLVFGLVFVIMISWIFSGWPQILDFPPEIQEARAATERKSPDGLLQQDNLSGAVTDIDEDPDAPGTDWLTYTTAGIDTVARVSFPTPTGSLTVGAGLQEFKIWVRRAFVGVAKTPTVRIELYENGVPKATVLSDTNVTNDTGILLSGTWDANLLGTADGSLVECFIHGTVSVAGSNKSMIEVGAVEWNVDYNISPTISISQPDGVSDTVTVGDLYNITYSLADADNVVTAAFYYDTDTDMAGGTACTGCAAAAEGTDVTCSWDTTGVTAGSYYVYGVTSDGLNPDVKALSSGQITIEAASNSAPSISSISLNGGNDIILNEGTFKWATSTIAITDDGGCDTISSVVAKLYRTSTSTEGTTCSQDDLNCYIGIGSTTAQDNCVATTTGNICDGGVDTSVEYDCGFKIWYIADATDAGTYAGDIWAVAATSTDSGALTGTATNTLEIIEIISQNALSVTSLIDYGALDPDTNTAINQQTVITTTGNTAIDVEVSGIDMTGPGAITVGNQKYDIIDQAYASLTSTLTGSAVLQELDNTKPTATTSPITDIIYWGLNVPAGTPPGSYSGTNDFGAVSD